jgi:hypothetical protein
VQMVQVRGMAAAFLAFVCAAFLTANHRILAHETAECPLLGISSADVCLRG